MTSENLLTKKEARLLIEAHDLLDVLENEEEFQLLEKQNPALLAAKLQNHKFNESRAV